MITLTHHQSKIRWNCYPAGIKILLSFFGDEHDEDDIAILLDTSPDRGTNRWNIEKLARWGYDVRAGIGTIRYLEGALRVGHPVLLTVWLPKFDKNHTVVLVGLDEQHAYIYDPAQPYGPIAIKRTDLLGCWRLQGQFCAIVERDPNFVQFFYDTNGNPQDCYSLAPEHQTCFGRIEKITGILLTGDTLGGAPDPQDEANALSGLYRAWQNIRFPHIRVQAFNNRFLEPATLDYFAVELDAADTVRGYDWNGKEFLCTEVEYEIDHEKGIILATITGEASTWGPEGVAGLYPAYAPGDAPDEPPEYWGVWPTDDPPPWVEAGGVVYLVDGTSGRLFRTRNGRASNAASVVYEDLGVIDAGGIYFIALDEFDPANRGMACGPNGIFRTTNLNDDIPTWSADLTAWVWHAGDYVAHVVSSPILKDLWWATMWDPTIALGDAGIGRSQDGGDTWTWWRINDSWPTIEVEYAKVEASSHLYDWAWVMTFLTDNTCLRQRSINQSFAPPGNKDDKIIAGLTSALAVNVTHCYHRRFNNTDDNIALFGGRNQAANEARIVYSTDDGTTGTVVTLDTGGGANAETLWVGGFGLHYWALTRDDTNGYRLHISDDGTTWSLQHTFAGTTRYVLSWRLNENQLYATQDGAVAPLLISNDRGATWQAQTGNWAALGYNGDIRCCVACDV